MNIQEDTHNNIGIQQLSTMELFARQCNKKWPKKLNHVPVYPTQLFKQHLLRMDIGMRENNLKEDRHNSTQYETTAQKKQVNFTHCLLQQAVSGRKEKI